jgi:hypothetical protein
MGGDPKLEGLISDALHLLSWEPDASGEQSNLVDEFRRDRPGQILRVSRLRSCRHLQQVLSGKQSDNAHHLLGRYFDPLPFREPGELDVIGASGHDPMLIVGSHSCWRMATPLRVHLRDSHQNGGPVFLIFVADPITRRLSNYDTGRGQRFVD